MLTELTVFEEVVLQANMIVDDIVPELPHILARCDFGELVFLLEIEHL